MKYLNFILVIIALVSSCSTPIEPDYDSDYNLIESMEISEAIKLANDWKYTRPKITSYITSTELHIIFPDKREVLIALPIDEMFIAVAPYIEDTHTCSTHYLSSCQGELINKNFALTIVNDQERVVFEGNKSSLRNGFFELWLERDKRFSIKLGYQNKSTEFFIETFEDSNTCVTTVKI